MHRLRLLALPLVPLLLLLATAGAAHVCVLRDSPNTPAVTLSPARVNDDYCDCLDASDETRTSACPNGAFVCRNAAHRPRTIPSSWVGDGSCDCCDGSDEKPGICRDECRVLREREIGNARARADSIARGVAKRQAYVNVVHKGLEKDARELKRLERELSAVIRALHRSTKLADALRKRRDWERRMPVVESDNVEAHAGTTDHAMDDDLEHDDEGEDADRDADDDEDDDHDHDPEEEDGDDDEEHAEEDDNDAEHIGENKDDEHAEDDDEGDDHEEEDDDGDEHEDDDDEGDEHADDDEEGEHEVDEKETTADARGVETSNHVASEASHAEGSASSTPHSEVDPEPSLNIDSVCAQLETKGSNPVVRYLRFIRAVLQSKLHRLAPKVFRVRSNSALSGLGACVDQADAAKWDLDSRKTSLEDKIKSLKKRSAIDYGPDKALRKLDGECTKTKVTQYEFEHCPFDLVRQYEHGSAIAVLGRFDGWEGEGEGRVMKYTRGDTCWNGPARSVKVQLLCGEKEEILSVDEPNRCTYTMKFRTPAVCEQKMADAILAEVERDSQEKQEL